MFSSAILELKSPKKSATKIITNAIQSLQSFVCVCVFFLTIKNNNGWLIWS